MTNTTKARRGTLKVGMLLIRVEDTTVYRVTTDLRGGAFRLLPYRRQGREVTVAVVGAAIVGDGSVWRVV